MESFFKWHYQRYVFDTKMMMDTKDINKSFTHISVDAALYRVVNWGNTLFNFKEYVKQPFRIFIKILPMGDEHVITNRNITSIHCVFKCRKIFWGLFSDYRTQGFPVFSDMIIIVLLSVTNSPMTCDG